MSANSLRRRDAGCQEAARKASERRRLPAPVPPTDKMAGMRVSLFVLIVLRAAVAFAADLAAEPAIGREELRARRARLATEMQDGVLILLGAKEPSEDRIAFHQNADFLYLTGVD